jgi:hypothetical protein
MKKTFNNAIELAKWINANISNPLRQEQLMLQGIRNNYTIIL